MAESGSRPRKRRAEEESAAEISSSPTGSSPPKTACFEDSLSVYFASKTQSPGTKRRKQDIEEQTAQAAVLNASARHAEVVMMREAILGNQESPESKTMRKEIAREDATTRAAESANRKLEAEARKEETKSARELQAGMMAMVSKMMDKLN